MNKQPLPLFQMKITLMDIDPPVWRRLLVRSDTTLADLHAIVQAAMGWTNSHLHQFKIEGVRFSYPYEPVHLLELTAIDSTAVHLYNVIPINLQYRGDSHPTIEYAYDFGDGWLHLLEFEAVLQAKPGQKTPVCIEGARACPPEDCGGPHGYRELLAALKDPKHPAHEMYRDWIGGFDPEEFNVKETNGRIRMRRDLL